jgi:hypothetical protein
MMVNKITELTVFESPDGGRTVYARKPGTTKRELHWQDPQLQQELQELESSKRWVEIFQARKKAMRYYRTAYETEVITALKKKYGFRKNSSVVDILLYLEKIDGNNNNGSIQPLQ